MPTYKQAIGLQYNQMNESTYHKLDFEVALPVTSTDAVAYCKADAFWTRVWHAIPKKLKVVWQLQGGIIRPLFSSKETSINDRFFVTHAMGYSHIGHAFKSGVP